MRILVGKFGRRVDDIFGRRFGIGVSTSKLIIKAKETKIKIIFRIREGVAIGRLWDFCCESL